MSIRKQWAFSATGMVCFWLLAAASVYAVTPADYEPSISKDWLIAVLILMVGALCGLGIKEILRRLDRLETRINEIEREE